MDYKDGANVNNTTTLEVTLDTPVARPATRKSIVPAILIGLALLYLGVVLVLPLIAVFYQALSGGVALYFKALVEPEALHAIYLTLVVTAITVPLNAVFGVMAAWAITKFYFRGRHLLVTMIDLPFSISPVVAGLMFVLVYGVHGWLGGWLESWGIKVIFTSLGITLVTMFITLPFIARELLPLMQEQGRDAEEAAVSLGARGWQVFWYVTLPNIKWALLYGVILCNARAMGEFGAVSVVSGHIRGSTNTLPLHIEILHNEFQFTAAFAVASLLTLLAVVTLVLKRLVAGHHHEHQRRKHP